MNKCFTRLISVTLMAILLLSSVAIADCKPCCQSTGYNVKNECKKSVFINFELNLDFTLELFQKKEVPAPKKANEQQKPSKPETKKLDSGIDWISVNQFSTKGTIICDGTILYSSTLACASELATLKFGTCVEIIKVSKDWVQICVPEIGAGYVETNTLVNGEITFPFYVHPMREVKVRLNPSLSSNVVGYVQKDDLVEGDSIVINANGMWVVTKCGYYIWGRYVLPCCHNHHD